MKTCTNCGTQFSPMMVIDGKMRHLYKRKFCLGCSPFGSHNTSKKPIRPKATDGEKYCTRCNETKPLAEFYIKRSRNGYTAYCKNCLSDQWSERQREFKQACVDYKGGKCICCGYNRCLWALEFHHTDPSKKDFHLAKVRVLDVESVKPELDKTVLVCCRCHREIHAGLLSVPGGTRTHNTAI